MTVIGTYDPYLVALSISVACLASYTALDLGSRIRGSRGRARLAWIATAATAMGGGIWSMHFIGMLAFVMPIPVSYDFGLTLLSLVAAIGVTGFGFFVIGTRRATALEFVCSGIFMGIGIIAMHYTGMVAMRMPADIRYDPVLVALSVLIAIGASIAALWLAFRTTTARISQEFLAAVIMGFAISGMHYTGMAAATFIGAPGMDEARGKPALAQTDLALAIATITFVILLLVLVASAFDRKLVQRSSELDVANRQLRQANQELVAIYEQGLYAAHLDLDGRLIHGNRACIENCGFARADIIGRPFWECGWWNRSPEIQGFIRKAVENAVASESFRGESRYFWADGSEHVVDVALIPIKDEARRVVFVLATGMDITQRKRAEEQVHLLMREMSHRGKNMLSLVQAIARQTATSDPEHFIERFTDRIQVLAANQDLLVQTRWEGVDVDDLARAQLAHFSDLVGYRISLNGPKLRLNGAAAQAIGMALHELATNAGKYGSLSTDAGRVDIVWRVDGDAFKMGWTERYGPPVKPPDRRGFGSTVIEAMAKRAVDGEVQFEYHPAGVAWHLTCPAANALEPQGRERNQDKGRSS
jgi:PAS domain S-box-containing protein